MCTCMHTETHVRVHKRMGTHTQRGAYTNMHTHTWAQEGDAHTLLGDALPATMHLLPCHECALVALQSCHCPRAGGHCCRARRPGAWMGALSCGDDSQPRGGRSCRVSWEPHCPPYTPLHTTHITLSTHYTFLCTHLYTHIHSLCTHLYTHLKTPVHTPTLTTHYTCLCTHLYRDLHTPHTPTCHTYIHSLHATHVLHASIHTSTHSTHTYMPHIRTLTTTACAHICTHTYTPHTIHTAHICTHLCTRTILPYTSTHTYTHTTHTCAPSALTHVCTHLYTHLYTMDRAPSASPCTLACSCAWSHPHAQRAVCGSSSRRGSGKAAQGHVCAQSRGQSHEAMVPGLRSHRAQEGQLLTLGSQCWATSCAHTCVCVCKPAPMSLTME